jgi:hypothetical protein
MANIAQQIGGFGNLGNATPTREGFGVTTGTVVPLPAPEPGLIRFRAIAYPTLGLVAELNGIPTISGYGVVATIDVPHGIGISSPSGRPPLRMSIPLLLDRWSERRSVEPELAMLERLLGIGPSPSIPPQIIIEGIGVPHSYSRDPGRRWRLTDDPEWGDDVRTVRSSGSRGYVEVTVSALEVTDPQVDIEVDSPTRRFFTIPRTGHPRTLRGVAKKFGRDWRQLRKLNPTLTLAGDPDHPIKGGTKVRLS